MAQRTVTILSDDLDGKEAVDIETVTFGFDGATYEVDLSAKNRTALEKALAPYLAVARKAGFPRPRAKRVPRGRATSEDRQWLRKNGFPDVKDRGRLSGDATEALKNR